MNKRANGVNSSSSSSTTITTVLWTMLLILLGLALAIAIIALILSGLMWPNQGCNTPICKNCNSSCTQCIANCTNTTGKITTIITDNNTLTGINGTLNISGLCGIRTDIDSSGNLTISDVRELSKYVVGQDNCSEFTTPQDAYNQAILDGVTAATIFIKPGIYSFGDTLFPITTPGITFYGLPGGNVIFMSNATTGGITTTTTLDMINFVIFQGITFGGIGDSNGFLLNVTSGQTIITNCFCLNSNFRIMVADGTALTIRESQINTLPPSDFITGIGTDLSVLMEDVDMYVTQGVVGGHVINMPLGFNNISIFTCDIWLNFYDGLIAGPLSGSTSDNLVLIRLSEIAETIFASPIFPTHLILQNGHINVNLYHNQINVDGFILYQNVNSVTADVHNLLMVFNNVETGNSTVRIDATVIGGVNDINFFHNNLNVVNAQDYIYIPTATAGDGLNIKLIATSLDTTTVGPGEYCLGPQPAITALYIVGGGSVHLGGATVCNGVTQSNLAFL